MKKAHKEVPSRNISVCYKQTRERKRNVPGDPRGLGETDSRNPSPRPQRAGYTSLVITVLNDLTAVSASVDSWPVACFVSSRRDFSGSGSSPASRP